MTIFVNFLSINLAFIYFEALIFINFYTRADPRNTEEVLNVNASSQNSTTAVDKRLVLCTRYVWGKHKAYDFEKLYLPFTKQ